MTLVVQFIRKMDDPLIDYLHANLDDIDVDLRFPETENEADLLESIGEADVLVGWRPSYELLEKSTKARFFINPGVGVKRHIEPFKKLNMSRKIPLTLINGHGNAFFTAEHAVALLLALYNKIVPYHNNMVSGKWRSSDPGSSITLRGKTVGLLGYGAINTYVHQFLKGFEVKFAVLKRSWDRNYIGIDMYTPEELDGFMSASDIVIVAIPHTSETEGMVGEKELSLLGSEGVIINVGRGVIIQENALYNALVKKEIAGAGIDVWYNYQPSENENGEKYPSDEKFHELENVVLSPHRAASPFDNLERWDEQIENIRRISEGRDDLLNVVDLEREY